jgi:hypothetical protein
MALFCAGAMFLNYCKVNVLSSEKAVSSLNGESFEYSVSDNKFSVARNGKLIGAIPTERNLKFRRFVFEFVPKLGCNATLIFAKALVVGGTAAAAGANFFAAAGGAFLADAGAIGGAALATGAALVEVPGGAAVAATLGGAGEIAAAAAAEAAAVGAGATIAAIAVPILIGAGVGAGLA